MFPHNFAVLYLSAPLREVLLFNVSCSSVARLLIGSWIRLLAQ